MVIILNNMYTGRYITQQGKLGHECINLVRADDKRFYIWLNSMGVCTQKGVDDSTIIMVRCLNANLYKVLAKAVNCKLCDGANISRKRGNKGKKDKADRYNEQLKIGAKGEIVTYNGKCPMKDIFNKKDMFATFWTEKLYETKGDIYLTNIKEDENIANGIYYADFKISEAMRAYIGENHGAKSDLEKLIKADVWKDISQPNVQEIDLPEFNFFKLIRKDKDELSFSNALAYFIDKAGVNDFLGSCLKVSGKFLDDEYKLLREKNNIDISFFGKNNVVIIENKIDAYITYDKKKTVKKQVEDAVKAYFPDLRGREREEKENEIKEAFSKYTGEVSQLSKYYFYAAAYLLSREENEVEISEIENHIKCFLLIPEYSRKQFKSKGDYYQSDFLLSDKYKIITYKDIFEYFDENQRLLNDPYIKDFTSALKPLKKEFNNDIEEEMKERFYKKIGKI